MGGAELARATTVAIEMAGERRERRLGKPRIRWRPPPAQEVIDGIELAFEVLGLAPSATQDEVKARFRALAKEWHPDRFTNNAPKPAEASVRMSQINVAYSVICEARRW